MKLVDPCNITNFYRNDQELEIFWVFCILVAGKPSNWAAKKVQDLHRELGYPEYLVRAAAHMSFFWNDLYGILQRIRTGQYERIKWALKESASLDLRNGDLDSLLGIYGVGNKTARFFLMHSRPN